MKKKRILIVSMILAASMSSASFAGEWKQDTVGWWYQNDDGSYPINTWQWIDGNHDDISESYFFDANGYCLMNTITPDGYAVDLNGAWIVDGIVQTKVSEQTSAPASTQVSNSASSQVSESQVWISSTGEKYHSIPDCGRMDPSKASQLSLDDTLSRGYTPCSKCY